jgi:hypothetical protein
MYTFAPYMTRHRLGKQSAVDRVDTLTVSVFPLCFEKNRHCAEQMNHVVISREPNEEYLQ